MFYIIPEWKAPLVEGAAGASPGQAWTWLGDESMHPFWCIRRVPPSKLSEGAFNMEYKHITFTTVVVGCVAGKAASVAVSVSVPFLTNTVNLEADTQLVFEVEEPAKKAKNPKTWKQQIADDAKDEQKTAKAAKAKAKQQAKQSAIAIDI